MTKAVIDRLRYSDRLAYCLRESSLPATVLHHASALLQALSNDISPHQRVRHRLSVAYIDGRKDYQQASFSVLNLRDSQTVASLRAIVSTLCVARICLSCPTRVVSCTEGYTVH